ncbi:M48 family metalloprotease [Ferroplasma acidarmanus]|nr:M48 family metalloprotease [Ferroplasma acidarmanus]
MILIFARVVSSTSTGTSVYGGFKAMKNNITPYNFHLGNSASYNILASLISFAVILLIMIQLQSSKQGRKTDITQRFSAIIDYDLSKKYTALTKHITHVDLEVFKFPEVNKTYRSPSFTPLGKQAKIFINENFFHSLDDSEREALVFHEIHHFIRKDAAKTYILALTILLIAAVSLIVLIQFWLSGFIFFL